MSNPQSASERSPQTESSDLNIFCTEEIAREMAAAGIDHMTGSQLALRGLGNVLRDTFEQRRRANLAAAVVTGTPSVVIRSGKASAGITLSEKSAQDINAGHGIGLRLPRLPKKQLGGGFDDKLSSPDSTYIEATKPRAEAKVYTRDGFLKHAYENLGTREIIEVTVPAEGLMSPEEDEANQVSQFANGLIRAMTEPYAIQEKVAKGRTTYDVTQRTAFGPTVRELIKSYVRLGIPDKADAVPSLDDNPYLLARFHEVEQQQGRAIAVVAAPSPEPSA